MTESKYPLCQLILANGHRCQCPAEKGRDFCVTHNRDRQRQRNIVHARKIKERVNPKRADYRELDDLNAFIYESLEIPPLESLAAVQVAITNISRAIGSQHIDTKRARMLVDMCELAVRSFRIRDFFTREHQMPVDAVDLTPVKPLGSDDDGFVLPEEADLKKCHQELRDAIGQEKADSDRARQLFGNLAS